MAILSSDKLEMPFGTSAHEQLQGPENVGDVLVDCSGWIALFYLCSQCDCKTKIKAIFNIQ